MPRYDFRDKETGEVTEYSMSWKDYDQFLLDNPNLERYHTPENLHQFSDALRLDVPGLKKCDPAFEHGVIERIKATVPGNTLKDGHKTQGKRWI